MSTKHPELMSCRWIQRFDEIDSKQWDELIEHNHPLLKHAFLANMAQTGVFGDKTGWHPCCLLVEQAGELIGVFLLFLKHNSWGEFVFDQSIAEAYQRYGYEYYPKLVSAIPFSPVFGQRLLVKAENRARVFPLMVQQVQILAEQNRCSSVHVLFAAEDERDFLRAQNYITRLDCQYHWFNRDYTDFNDFLQRLSARKRKSIKKERQKVRDAGITFRRLTGKTASTEDWAEFTAFYNDTYDKKWGVPVFNQAFFQRCAADLGDQMLLVMADKDGQSIAAALMYASDTTLYGRHWGCAEFIDGLHFETCYYQGIDYCIEHRLQCFEPGAQGAHKLARGFDPVLTESLHWLLEPEFRPAVAHFAKQEAISLRDYAVQCQAQSAYKK